MKLLYRIPILVRKAWFVEWIFHKHFTERNIRSKSIREFHFMWWYVCCLRHSFWDNIFTQVKGNRSRRKALLIPEPFTGCWENRSCASCLFPMLLFCRICASSLWCSARFRSCSILIVCSREGLSCGRVYHLCEFCTMHGLTVTEYCRFYLDIVLVPSGDRRNVPDNIYHHLPGWFSVFLFWHGFTGKVEKSMLYLTYLNSK